ncbi:acylphosphatase [Enterovirga rhinocerotis]|uniref:Acylphosphatase n=1 Tax=Enterovirga rhinocerotis TaxID=1339210 RepID=A0A4R7C5T2_9HYPH|nr:acylphosphatase [Enterovirga rhinocerotis]TDR93758.1 acylphosphatase [Enterovirga rhinocerotis]
MSEATQVRAIIHGRVQGVGFRAWTASTAREAGLDGWVRNRRDGTVEAVFRGPEERVRAMLDLCREGPPAARVDRIETGPAEPGEAVTTGFEQRPTV